MKKLLLLVLILFISISAVSASDNLTDAVSGVSDDLVCDAVDDSSQVSLDENKDSISMEDDSNAVDSAEEDLLGNGTGPAYTIKGENLVWYLKADPTYKFKVVDENGTGVAVKNVALKINGKTKYVSTDANGNGQLKLTGLKAGLYEINGRYGDTTFKNKIKLFEPRIKSKNITSVYGKNAKYVFRILDNSGKPMAHKKVKFAVNNKGFVKKTNAKGYISFYLNFESGKYIIKYYADHISGRNLYTVNNFVKLNILKWGLVGDVSKAPLIRNHMPKDSVWVKKAVDATKEGLPLLTIKGGKGKTVFMTAGVHGNELNSQVAAMKMIKYLTTHKIKGTVYIIPFVNVKAISQKVRLTNYDFNRVAHVSGTVSNNIMNLIFRNNCDAFGDFHTTVSPGVPGINVVLGYTSSSKCISLTNYIASNAKVNKIFYYPGQKYCWSLADYGNLHGVPSVICEVISPVNVVSDHATSLSYKQMTYFLKFHSII